MKSGSLVVQLIETIVAQGITRNSPSSSHINPMNEEQPTSRAWQPPLTFLLESGSGAAVPSL